ncbi:MAG: ABC transporter permease [Gammaproteobacteria bacterium]|nr:MAG: ABC transporter permease [Gammaproteobacteria bacterium]
MAAGRALRLRGMIRKETLQILRDPSSIAIAFVLPVVLLFLFGYGVSLDSYHVPVGLVIEAPDAATASFRGAFEHSEYFRPVLYRDIRAAEADLAAHRIQGIVWLRADFERRVLAGDGGAVAVRVNGVDANQARITEGYIQGAWLHWLEEHAGVPLRGARLEPRVWFNAALISRHFLVPGLIAIIMTLIGSLLTAMVVAREWDRGTVEAMMVTPLHIGEMVVGKLVPYFLLGMGGMLFTVALAVWQFGVPLRGSFALLLGSGALFMLVALGMGLLISILAKNQFVAGQIAIVVTFLPAFILSGFLFEIRAMPVPIQVLTHVVPARYFVAILQSLFLAGDVWPVVLPNLGALALLALLLFALVRKKARKRLA